MINTNTNKTVNDFEIGQNVTYVPNHALGNSGHRDCQCGVVSSKNDTYVFVKFRVTDVNGQACDPSNLI